MHKIVAVLACRNEGSRLYGKPLHNLCLEKKIKIIDQIILTIKKFKKIHEIILAISNDEQNKIYEKISKKHKIKFIYGSTENVLSRLIKAGRKTKATDIFRVTTESPFLHFEFINESINNHISKNFDASLCWDMIDGTGFEIIKMSALIKSNFEGKKKHKSELCTLYIRENQKKFKIKKIYPPKSLLRRDIRLTVDYPEDLILCRKIYKYFKKDAPLFNIKKVVNYLDRNKNLKNLIKPYVAKGYKDMY